ncbi:MAG: 7-carboxy-7-deazaguanine synthase QueE [Pseudomonadota bacterium]
MDSVRITEIFCSIQGESTTVGEPTVFVRLTGCPLRCHYCDTAYAFSGGEKIQIEDVVERVGSFGVHYVTVTGGEPLAQASCQPLMSHLCDAGHSVSLETSGAISVAEVDQRVRIIMDVKTPGSGEEAKNLSSNLAHLKPIDELKFVICDRQDYEFAIRMVEESALSDRHQVLFSPSHGQIHPRELADWIIADKTPVRLQLQMHKFLWGNEPGR